MTVRKKPTIRKTHRHAFRFELDDGTIIPVWAKVRAARKKVALVLTKEHVQKSLAISGQGNTQKCAMAICSKAHGDAFPHPFILLDWTYNRVYFLTKLDQKRGTSECVVYTHHDNIAPLFDTTVGMKKILKSLEKKGSKTIRLYPPEVRAREAGRPRGKNTGERTRTIRAKGAALRIARANEGLKVAALATA